MSIYGILPPLHIRLLELQPGNFGSSFHGKLREVSLDNPTTYEALSYTWGDPGTASTLNCEGASIPLTLNLQLALERLRRVGEVRILWIDQICINQDDIVERGQQVKLMGDIYRKAEVVDIWIGEEDEETQLAVRAVGHLMGCFTDASENDGNNEEFIPNVIQKLGLLFVKSPSWIAARKIFERPYFRRMWIVQEVVLGNRCAVMCGSHVMGWDELSKASFCLEMDDEKLVEAHRVVGMMRLLKSGSEERTLLHLLNQTYNLLCTNPKDKVYGILGLVSDVCEGEVVVDYSLSCQEIYIAVATLCIRKYSSLAVLCCVRNPQTLSGLPSWVPDWNTVSRVSQSLGFRTREKYLAGGRSSSRYRFSPNGFTLQVLGKKMDAVKILGAVMPGTEVDEDVRGAVYDTWEILAQTVSPYPTGETYPTIFWRTCIADGQTRGKDSDEIRQKLWESRNYLVQRNRNNELEPPEELSVVNSRETQFQTLLEAASYGRRLVITQRGYLGLVPAETQETNTLCVFCGCQVPFVIRQMQGGEGYTLIGECYILGWMDGSTFDTSTNPSEEFQIS
ncbi:hypothetical protein HYFRA_00013799 [Hymenoscyphus fraxineus]|uniref:Heterokaryon incompatibility domain-containing protein n=1 Tax=Hymenoscyphus fraxineus TaxID=746836 RepID=A0A9N9LB43_9HELO|nr:hypothetical protein HYFRA_00013799 [Hymenoscyphus fraxineus]